MPLNKKLDLNVEDFLFKPRGTIDIVIPEKAIEQNDGIKWKNISQTPPLNNTPQPVVNNMQMAQKNPITNLTSTEEAVLSPTEKVIASRT